MTIIGHLADGQPITFQDHRTGTPAAEPLRLPVTMTEVAGHEARHAAVGLLLDFRPTEARADIPDNTAYGRVTFDFDGEKWDRTRLAEKAIVMLAGGIGEKSWPPTWPPNPTAAEHDEQELAALAELLELDQQTWDGLINITKTIVRHPGIKHLANAISSLLESGLALDNRQLADAYAMEHKHDAEHHNKPAPTDAEREHDTHRTQAKQWMRDTLTAGVDYHQHQQAENLRRKVEAITIELATG